MMKTETRYICEICGTSYASQKLAKMCEGFQLEPASVKPGDSVLVYERYGEPEKDEIASVELRGTAQFIADRQDDEFDEKTANRWDFHVWFVTTNNIHQISKDEYNDTFSIDNVMVDGMWQRYRNGKLSPEKE